MGSGLVSCRDDKVTMRPYWNGRVDTHVLDHVAEWLAIGSVSSATTGCDCKPILIPSPDLLSSF